MWPMAATRFLKTRLSPEQKRHVQTLASAQLMTESMWLRRLVIEALNHQLSRSMKEEAAAKVLRDVGQRIASTRLYIRLRPEDRLLLRERAAARGMPAATYVSILVRAHLRNLSPLPKNELHALKQSVAELGAIGRNLNQVARAANHGVRVTDPGPEDLQAMLRVCSALRDHVKALIKANVDTWEMGHAENPR